MVSFLMTTLIVSLIAAALALALVVVERFIANYGQCTITLNSKRTITVEGGKSLLSVLQAEKIFIPSACGGRGTCGFCKVRLLRVQVDFADGNAVYDQGLPIASVCPGQVRGDLAIEIPEALLMFRNIQLAVEH